MKICCDVQYEDLHDQRDQRTIVATVLYNGPRYKGQASGDPLNSPSGGQVGGRPR